jgi:hypothetical protein
MCTNCVPVLADKKQKEKNEKRLARTRVTGPVTLVEQEQLISPLHMSSVPFLSVVRVARSLGSVQCFIDLFGPFVLFHLAIVLSVLQCTDYGYPFGIFKRFLTKKKHISI